MKTFKVTLAYDGTGTVGWQRQETGVSIQGLLEESLRHLDDREIAVVGAGRTDAGVHAIGQVASFTIDRCIEPAALVRALNATLPRHVRVLKAEEVSPTFHARFHATSKVYQYRIWNGEVVMPFDRAYAWHVVGPLDREAMRAASVLVEGRHDFAAFQSAGSARASTIREVFSSRILVGGSALADVAPDADASHSHAERAGCDESLIVYRIAGDGFLRHMVRTIVGSLVEIGRGRQPVEWMTQILSGRDRRLAGPTAPPCGLVLMRVEYGGTITSKDPVHVA